MDEEKDEFKEEIAEFDPYKLFKMPGAHFSVFVISSLVLPLIGVFSPAYGKFVASVFGVSLLFVFPVNAVLRYVKKEKVSIKNNMGVVLAFSYITNLILNYSAGFWNITVKFLFAVPIVIFILFVYFLVHELSYKLLVVQSWKKGLYNLLLVIPVTMGIVSLVFFLLDHFKILKFQTIREQVEGAIKILTGG